MFCPFRGRYDPLRVGAGLGMGESGVRERAGRADAGVRAFDLIAAKLRRPATRPGTIRRSSLIDKLVQGGSGPVVSVVAPAGYGKTTLLAQWAEHDGQSFAWVQVDEQDNDPKVLLRYVAEALDAIEPVGERVFDALASPASSVPASVVPRLGLAFASMTVPVVLVLDDVHLLRNVQCRAALSVLADHVPARGRLVFAGRDTPPVRVARLRAEGRIVEIGAADLALTRQETAVLLRAAQVTLAEEDVADLHRHTEGWAVGAVPGGAVPAGRGLAAAPGGLLRRRRPVRQRLRRVGAAGADLPRAAGVLDPGRSPGADVRAAVRGGAGPARVSRDPGRSRRVEPAAGAAGPAGGVVPLSSPVP